MERNPLWKVFLNMVAERWDFCRDDIYYLGVVTLLTPQGGERCGKEKAARTKTTNPLLEEGVGIPSGGWVGSSHTGMIMEQWPPRSFPLPSILGHRKEPPPPRPGCLVDTQSSRNVALVSVAQGDGGIEKIMGRPLTKMTLTSMSQAESGL